MHKITVRVPGHVRILQGLVAAAALLVTAACTTPTPRVATDTPDSPDSQPAASEPETAETSRPTPPPAPVRETPPQTPPQPPSAPAPEPASVSETEPAPVAAAPAVEPEPAASTPPPAPAPSGVSVSGRIVVDVSQVDDADADSIRDTVIYFEPAGMSVPAEPQNFKITTRRKRLIPDVLVVPVGSTVEFPNEDSILHNVFSVSSAANFDLGLYGEGESKSHTFTEPGLAIIHCNVHHAMRADVLVVDTPYFGRPDADGNFSIVGIEPAAGELVAWHPRAGFVRRQISLPTNESPELVLTLVRPRIPDHLDKTGQPYRPERPGRR